MKPGGRPWQGYDRALNHTLAYLGRYALLGTIPAVLISLLFPLGDAILTPILIHIGSIAVLLPGAFLVNFAGLRICPLRSWRQYPRRAMEAALLSVVTVWTGVVICGLSGLGPPGFLIGLVGGAEAWALHCCGLAVLLSSLSLAVIWAIPAPMTAHRP